VRAREAGPSARSVKVMREPPLPRKSRSDAHASPPLWTARSYLEPIPNAPVWTARRAPRRGDSAVWGVV
jgi:hypothetical protein